MERLTIWRKLSGKKIIIAGGESCQKENFRNNLAFIASSRGGLFQISDDLEHAEPEDYVFLFPGKGTPQDQERFLTDLQLLAQARPQTAVLVSDCCVYGRQFGECHLLRENEIGYLGHTRPENQTAFACRLAEHLVCRLAREEELDLRIVRADAGQSADRQAAVTEAAIRVLLYGKSGEAYNLPVQEQAETPGSALSPIPTEMDTTKYQGLGKE